MDPAERTARERLIQPRGRALIVSMTEYQSALLPGADREFMACGLGRRDIAIVGLELGGHGLVESGKGAEIVATCTTLSNGRPVMTMAIAAPTPRRSTSAD